MDLNTHRFVALQDARCFATDDRFSSEGAKEVPRILIVEDDYVVGLELEAGLSGAGFSVVGTANSAQQAIRLAHSERPMLAVMDIRLAGRRDGIEAAIEMVKSCGVRCIFATAHHDAETRARAKEAAPLGWLLKPYQLGALISLIDIAIAELKKGRS